MATRIFRMMAGELTSVEARRMITEKQAAYSSAQVAGALALLTGGPVAASREMLDVYRLAVSANRSRFALGR